VRNFPHNQGLFVLCVALAAIVRTTGVVVAVLMTCSAHLLARRSPTVNGSTHSLARIICLRAQATTVNRVWRTLSVASVGMPD
jgi:hypothetical protein